MPANRSIAIVSKPLHQPDREAIRRSYRPEKVRILFVGESPPASGRFFYQQDSGLYRAFRDAFRTIDESINDDNFLAVFRSAGCYLIDTCSEPVDRMDRKPRRSACLAGEPGLSRQIRALQPEVIVSLLRSIRPIVERAALKASWRGPLLDLPYPGRWKRHREVFREALLPRIETLIAERRGHEKAAAAGDGRVKCPS